MRQHSAKTLALAVCGCTALWSVQAAAQSGNNQPTLEQLQLQIQQLQQQVQDMQVQQQQARHQQQQLQTQQQTTSTAQKKSDKSLTITGGVVGEYQAFLDHANARDQSTAGNLILDYFDLGVAGNAGHSITFAADYRWSPSGNIGGNSNSFLHKGWAAYNFGAGDSSQIKGGFFQVPYGNLAYGYQSFWAPARYYLSFNDDQAAGLGYKYKANGLRFDIAAFKNDDFGQAATYGANPAGDFQRINGGAVRLGYTFNHGNDNTLNVSASVRGGQLNVEAPESDRDDYGTHWAAALAATANIGLWTLQGQINSYDYNVPDNLGQDPNTITFENYGFQYNVPASGQMYSFSFARAIPVSLGPISSFSVYDDIDYLDIGDPYTGTVNLDGDTGVIDDNTVFNVAGVSMAAGPIMVWAEIISAKNGALGFDGPNDGDWHHRFNLTAAYYFSGDLIQ